MKRYITQIPFRLLSTAVRRMPAERSEWGAAMLAELAQLQHPVARWQFALSCLRVALFPPHRGGPVMDDRLKYWCATAGTAALFSLLIGVIHSLLLFATDSPDTHPGLGTLQFYLDFFRSWLVLTLVLTPVMSGLRAGSTMPLRQLMIPIGAAASFGLLLVAPFAWMEWSNNPGIQSGEFTFPAVLFFGLWLGPVVFFLGATPIVRAVRAGEGILANPIALLLRVALLSLLAIGWVSLVQDQMPCFLGGVPGCD